MTSAQYSGRFAPSPTGPLHFGSLLAAMASYCDARSNNGIWRLRIDDLDPPREMPGATNHIKQTIKNYGLNWDGDAIHQSQRTQHYQDNLSRLNELQLLFPCDCSRAKLAGKSVYPGYCNPVSTPAISSLSESHLKVQNKLENGNPDHAIRIIIDSSVRFNDSIQGHQQFDAGVPGDTIVVRRDDLFAYALACAIDDADGVSHVVRGSDLLSSTASQFAIIERLGLRPPTYAHIPIAVNNHQQKLSKQTHAQSLDSMPVLPTLLKAWQFLGQSSLRAHSIDAFWTSAIENWCLASVPRQSQLAAPA